jgi:hypothetical protein
LAKYFNSPRWLFVIFLTLCYNQHLPIMKSEFSLHKSKSSYLAFSLGLFLFAIYLLCYRGGFHSIDEVSIFAVTESLVKFGRVNTNQVAWTQWTTIQAEAQGFFGGDGQVYSKKGLALSLVQAPLYWLALHLPGLGMLQTVSVLNALITAATGSLIFMFLERLGYSAATALVSALSWGLATISFVYAKYLFSEPLTGFLLLLAVYMLLVYHQEWRLRHVVIAGLAVGFTVLARANNLFLIPIFGLYLLAISTWSNLRALKQSEIASYLRHEINPRHPLFVFVVSLTLPGALLLIYNALRSGNPFQTGYDLNLFSSNVLLGLYKLLFSPLRGLFIYSPIVILSLPGWWSLRRAHPAEAWLFAGLVAVTIGLFSAWSSGEGLSWGSRFLVPLIPLFALSLAPLIEQLILSKTPSSTHHVPRITHYVLRFTFYILLLLSFLIQLLGVIINPWIFLARLQAEFGGEFFLENTAALYDFRYTQMMGQLQAWSLENSDLAWQQPWGFDGLAFSLSLLLLLLAGGLLWANLRSWGSNKFALALHHPFTPSLSLLICLVVTYILLTRYYQTDRQFGPLDHGYIQALNLAASQARPGDSIVTVAHYHYHIPMNRFKARLPLIGFAQQTWPLPETALPLLATTTAGQTTWLVTVGFPPAAPDNAAEQWLATNLFKISDEWFPNETRLVRFVSLQPTLTRPIQVTLGDEIELMAIKLVDPIQAGQSLPIEFTWRPIRQPQVDYNLFLQLLGPDGRVITQHDSPPNGGYTLTSTWPARQLLVSRHGLMLPPELPPDDYRLIAGLYYPATGQRLPLKDGSDFVELGNITITSNLQSPISNLRSPFPLSSSLFPLSSSPSSTP